MTLEPVLLRLESLAPRFGRASGDVWALVSRARAGDLEGLRLSARAVVEVVLKDLVASELGQPSGPATLAALSDLVRLPANERLMPATVRSQLATVQAWGSTLTDANAGLGATTAILGWYVQSRGGGSVLTPSPSASIPVFLAPTPPPSAPPPVPAEPFDATFAPSKTPLPADPFERTLAPGSTPVPSTPVPSPAAAAVPAVVSPTAVAPGVPPPAAAPGPGAPRGLLLGAGLALAIGAAVATGVVVHQRARPVDASGLDARYRAWGEPPPPAACRAGAEWAALTPIAADDRALGALPAGRSAEAWYLLARAQVELNQPAAEALQQALKCPRFAAAADLQGRVWAIESEQRPDQAAALREQALASFDQALQFAPDFHRARFHRAGVLLKVPGRLEAAVADLREVITAEPLNAQAQLLLGFALDRQAASELRVADALAQANDAAAPEKAGLARRLTAESRQAYCRALDLGLADAAGRCQRAPP